MKLVFISSLNFSGSTLLDLLLGAHSKIFGIGEIDALLNPERSDKFLHTVNDVVCKCGKKMTECEIWGPFVDYLNENASEDYQKKYRKMLDIMGEKFGEDIFITDSSKYLSPLTNLLDNYQDRGLDSKDVYVIHLMKDVRCLATSMKRSNDGSSWDEFKYFNQWYRFNKKVSSMLNDSDVHHMKIGYEELCLYPEYCLELICNFLGLEYEPEMKDLKQTQSHLALGNMMRLDKKKSSKVYYDNRWFIEDSISFKYWLLFWIRNYNKREVYSNTVVKQKGARFQPH